MYDNTIVVDLCRDTYRSTYMVDLKMIDTLLFRQLPGDFEVVLQSLQISS
jgi:hypothetical protein